MTACFAKTLTCSYQPMEKPSKSGTNSPILGGCRAHLTWRRNLAKALTCGYQPMEKPSKSGTNSRSRADVGLG